MRNGNYRGMVMETKSRVSVSLVLFVCVGMWAVAGVAEGARDPLEQYNVVWETASKDSSGSMPIGNGDIGLNVWVEEDGDLLFYIRTYPKTSIFELM